MNIFHVVAAAAAFSSPIPACGCSPPVVSTPRLAEEIRSSHDLIFIGVVTDRKPKEIEPEYFGQNVRKMLVSFSVKKRVKGPELESVRVLAPISAACDRFSVSNEYLVFAKLVDGSYRIAHCTGAKRTGPDTDAELELLLDAATTNKALH